ncbi:16265_t:CDS:2, partial [Racocetra persica]
HLSHFCTSNVFTPSLQKSASEKIHWSKGHGVVKKALSLMIRLKCDDEFFDMIENFISSKTHELQLLEENKVASNVESQPAIMNLLVTKCRGRPSKHYKSSLEHCTISFLKIVLADVDLSRSDHSQLDKLLVIIKQNRMFSGNGSKLKD